MHCQDESGTVIDHVNSPLILQSDLLHFGNHAFVNATATAPPTEPATILGFPVPTGELGVQGKHVILHGSYSKSDSILFISK